MKGDRKAVAFLCSASGAIQKKIAGTMVAEPLLCPTGCAKEACGLGETVKALRL